jgi:hypothetical protein
MGMHKHGICGCRKGPGKSPKLRHHLKREAEKNVRRRRKSIMYSNVKEAFSAFKPK